MAGSGLERVSIVPNARMQGRTNKLAVLVYGEHSPVFDRLRNGSLFPAVHEATQKTDALLPAGIAFERNPAICNGAAAGAIVAAD